MALERSSKSNGVVGDSILNYEIFYLLDNILAKWPCNFCVPKEEEEEESIALFNGWLGSMGPTPSCMNDCINY